MLKRKAEINMTTLYVGLLETDEAVNETVDKLSKQPEDEVQWRLLQFEPKVQHTVPIADGDTSYGANYVTSIDPAGETLAQRLARRLHIRHTDAQRLAAGLHRGSLVVTVETTEAAAASIRRLLRAAGARIVTTEEVAGRLTPLAS